MTVTLPPHDLTPAAADRIAAAIIANWKERETHD